MKEELLTVNQQLKERIQEIIQTNADLDNLITSTAIATLFIDTDLCVRRFTPAAQYVFDLQDHDHNQPLAQVTHSLVYPTLLNDVQQVLTHDTLIERQVSTSEDEWFLVRMQPYRMQTGAIGGVMVTLSNITRQKNAETHIKRSQQHLLLLFDSIVDYAIFTMDVRGYIDYWGRGAEQIFGYTSQEAVGMHLRMLMIPEDRARKVDAKEMQIAREKGSADDDRWHLAKEGNRFYVSGKMMPLISQGQVSGYVKVARDLTEHHVAEAALQQSHDDLEQRIAERTRMLVQANEALRREIADHQKTEHERQYLLGQIVTIQEQERRRIAREVHDQLGQFVSAMRMGLAAISGQLRAGQNIDTMIASLQQQAQNLDMHMDKLALELRPIALDKLGLVAAVQHHVAEWSAMTNIHADVEVIGFDQMRLDDDIETTIYRIVQEALTNIAKHADATRVGVVLEQRASFVRAIIEDDGKGFDQATLPQRYDTRRPLGLVGMRERAALVWGTLTIESAVGQGTTLFVTIPLAPADDTLLLGDANGASLESAHFLRKNP